ncbi:MAG: DNA adenine methylase [Bacteroidota bacterium]
MDPVLPWPGGKRRLAKHIIERLPPHELYCETFGGQLAVLLRKEPSKLEAVNDLDSDLITFFRVVNFHKEAFMDEVALVLNSREEFGDYLKQPGLTDIQRAARWYTVQRLSFGGRGKHFGTSKMQGGAAHASRSRRLSAVDALSDRLDRVAVENLPWQRFFDQYDRPGGCFFVDPPYHEGMQYSAHAWTEADHIELADRLQHLEAGWVLTYDGTPFIRSLYEGCVIEEFPRKVAIGNRSGRSTRTMEEVIIRPAHQLE